jgi:signal transduction histidine kinase/ligand-binding sensor domain-containing protein
LKIVSRLSFWLLIQISTCVLIFCDRGAGQYRFDQWTADNGLPQNSVYSIKQTRDGYLWLTTLDGLVRFDGVKFTVFNKSNSPGIDNNRFISLFEPPSGDLWVGTEGSGVMRYRQGRFTSYGPEHGLENLGYVINGDPEGNLFFLSGDFRVYRFADEKFLLIDADLATASAAPAEQSESLFIYCFGRDEGPQVVCLSDGKLLKFTLADGLPSLNFLSRAQDRDGSLWALTTDAGMIHLKNGQVAEIYAPPDLLAEEPLLLTSGHRISLLSKDKQGALWLTDLKTRQKELLTRHPPDPLKNIKAEWGTSTLPDIRHGYEDREGNIWLGTLREGLFRVRKQVITTYSKVDGLLDNNVYPIFEDRNGGVWIGTTKGVFKYQNGAFTFIKGSENFYVDSLGEDASGRLLVSFGSSVFVLEENQFRTIYRGQDYVPIWAIYTDQENALWLGTEQGLVRLKDGLTTTFTTKEGLTGNNVKVMIDDQNGGFWIGSYGGLSHYKDGKFTSWTETANLTIRSLYQDAEGVLWIGTYDSGMTRFKDGKFNNYNTGNGLFNDGAFQILEDDQRNFWLSSNQGIYRVRKDELNELAEGKRKSITSIAYGKSDGLLNVECNGGRMPGGIRAGDGRLWFPTQDGVAVIDPETVKPNPQPPPVIIEDVKIDDKSIPVETRNSALADAQTAIEITPQQQNFEIEYTALSFINSENLRFRYKLDGLDNEWTEAGTRRTAYYPHVAPGDYTFRVTAANSDGVWNESGALIRITVLPPFYRTWWFYLLCIVTLAGLAYFIYRRRIAQFERAKKSQEELSRRLIELQEHERKRLAGDLHDSLSQNLVIIKNRAMMGLAKRDNIAHLIGQVEEIAEAAAESLTEVREIATSLRPFQIDRLGLTKAVQSLIRKATTPNLEINSQIDNIDGILPPEMEINLYRILQESLNNIIKHSKANEAAVTIKKAEKRIKIEIKDNGQGFDTSKRAGESESGTGFGLTGMSERARILGTVLNVESAMGNGTTIRFQINY